MVGKLNEDANYDCGGRRSRQLQRCSHEIGTNNQLFKERIEKRVRDCSDWRVRKKILPGKAGCDRTEGKEVKRLHYAASKTVCRERNSYQKEARPEVAWAPA